MEYDDIDRALFEWEIGTKYGNYDNISTESLGYIVKLLDSKEVDASGKEKRRTDSDDLITDSFYVREPEGREYNRYVSQEFIDTIKKAIGLAELKNDNVRAEKLNRILEIASQIKKEMDRATASELVHKLRYQQSMDLVQDEVLLNYIDRFFEELQNEASAGYALNTTIYVYLTNAKDKNDLLKRLEVVSLKLEEYEKIKSEESIEYVKKGIEVSIEDFESGDILGIDKELEER